ncbi:BRO-N domain-containing protein [Kaistella jeonii]|uniref:BRO-N domain-containing protein n=1 Tax=Kaistella jeonii TaxID=266749 RepID=UPI000A5F58A8|nr:Bro-N domain-containing protein [Kaistella jeonii]
MDHTSAPWKNPYLYYFKKTQITMNTLKLFEEKKIRSHWNEENETWYFSVIDVIEILTESSIPKRYWTDLKKKLTKEGSQLYENIVQLKLESSDEIKYTTDCLDPPNLLRLIQSIPSPKAEPFKQWLAKVGYERMQEIQNPEMGLDRARENWQKLGRSEKWIQKRMTGQHTRNKLTDYWKENKVSKSTEMERSGILELH